MEMHFKWECKRLRSLYHHPVWLRWLFLWILDKSQNPIDHCHNWWKAKVLSLISNSFFLKWSIRLYSGLSSLLEDIEKGNHDDEKCEENCRNYKKDFGHELPDCQFKGNQSKIQNLLKTQFVKETSQGTRSLLTKMKNLFRRKW